MNITRVVSEDLLFFTNLRRLDISDNEAPFEPFGLLHSWSSSIYSATRCKNVVVGNGFQHLEVLNASFNCLSSKDIDQLSTLLRIRELYVSHNWIRTLPPVMDRFSRLETLSLEQNGISGDEVFNFLAIIPRLRNLNLSHNKLTAFPEVRGRISASLSVEILTCTFCLFVLFCYCRQPCRAGEARRWILFARVSKSRAQQITSEEDILLLTELHSLRKLVLYGIR
ncbi:hypothetical protein PINS_up024532 [Pythium insidiosum]|nr:hypothetical protein PINS_up024532 [Pythium insidiosum]